jgi:dihydroorotate dehydrogenase (fumarate)
LITGITHDINQTGEKQMADLTTEYLGLKLKNPLMISSCGKMKDLENLKKGEQAGASAVILPSLFEEDISSAVEEDKAFAETAQHPEALAYLHQMGMILKPDLYIEHLESVKSTLKIPVIASLNCYSSDWWLDYAVRIEKAGADALELNIGIIPVSVEETSSDIENRMEHIVRTTRKVTRLPLTIKMGYHISSLPNTLKRLKLAGADGFVLFNRFYRPDIDVDKMVFKTASPLSSREELGTVLRWTGILTDLVPSSYSANTGIHDATDLIKVLAAGANAAQVCSVLYLKGIDYLTVMINDLAKWMDKYGYHDIESFRSRLSLEDDISGKYYQRLQYIKQLKS